MWSACTQDVENHLFGFLLILSLHAVKTPKKGGGVGGSTKLPEGQGWEFRGPNPSRLVRTHCCWTWAPALKGNNGCLGKRAWSQQRRGVPERFFYIQLYLPLIHFLTNNYFYSFFSPKYLFSPHMCLALCQARGHRNGRPCSLQLEQTTRTNTNLRNCSAEILQWYSRFLKISSLLIFLDSSLTYF